MPVLLVSDRKGESFSVDVLSFPMHIGRSGSNDLVLEDLAVSRNHLVLERHRKGVVVRCVSRRSETYVNRHLVRGIVPIRHGDCILLGNTRILYSEPDARAPLRLAGEVRNGGLSWQEGSRSSVETLPPPVPACVQPQEELRILRFLLESDKELVAHREPREIFSSLLELAHRVIPFERGFIATLDRNSVICETCSFPAGAGHPPFAVSKHVVEHVLGLREPIILDDATNVCGEETGPQSLICVPILDADRIEGFLYVECGQRRCAFDETHLRVLSHLANLAGMAIQNHRLFEQTVSAELMRTEIDRAARIQREFLPSTAPVVPGYLIRGISRPCSRVGGDFFHYGVLPEGQIAIAIGDVAGHGLDAALLMCSLQSVLAFCAEQGLPAEETVVRLNEHLVTRLPRNRFVTVFYGILDPRMHHLSYVNAGHLTPLLLGPRGDCTRLSGGGMPLGILGGQRYLSHCVSLGPGQMVLGFSDGVTEARAASGEEFGIERLVDLVCIPASNPDETIGRVLEAVRTYPASAQPQDDITLLALQRTE